METRVSVQTEADVNHRAAFSFSPLISHWPSHKNNSGMRRELESHRRSLPMAGLTLPDPRAQGTSRMPASTKTHPAVLAHAKLLPGTRLEIKKKKKTAFESVRVLQGSIILGRKP